MPFALKSYFNAPDVMNFCRSSPAFILLYPGDRAFDRVKSGSRSFAVLDECGNVTACIDLAQVEHVCSDSVSVSVLDWFDPPARHISVRDDQVFSFLRAEDVGIIDVPLVCIAREEHHVTAVDVEFKVACAEHNTVAEGPRSLGDDLQRVHTVVGTDFLAAQDSFVRINGESVPLLKVGAEIIRNETLDHLLLTEGQHSVDRFVPGLAYLDVVVVLADLKFMLVHGAEHLDKLALDSGANLSTTFRAGSSRGRRSFNHLKSILLF